MYKLILDFYKNNKKESWLIFVTFMLYSMFLTLKAIYFRLEIHHGEIKAIEVSNKYNFDVCIGYYMQDIDDLNNFYIKECICKNIRINSSELCLSAVNISDITNYYYINFFPLNISNLRTFNYKLYLDTNENIIYIQNLSYVFLATCYFYIIISFFIKTCRLFYFLRTRIHNYNPTIQPINENIQTNEPIIDITVINDIRQYEGICTICLEEFIENQEVFLHKCNNKYHKQCILDWIKIKNTCPLCKEKI